MKESDLFQFGNTLFFQKNNNDKFKIDIVQVSSTSYVRGCLSKWSDHGGWLFICENDLEGNEEDVKEITIKMLKECANQFLTPSYYDDEVYEDEDFGDSDEDFNDEEDDYFESIDDEDDEDFPF